MQIMGWSQQGGLDIYPPSVWRVYPPVCVAGSPALDVQGIEVID